VSWTVELSEEVAAWYSALNDRDAALADQAIDRLRDVGPLLRMPHARNLGDSLFELRFTCEQVARRITYSFNPERKVITLTTFRKQRDNERREVTRARNVLKRTRREW
jgi:hypothetical protein